MGAVLGILLVLMSDGRVLDADTRKLVATLPPKTREFSSQGSRVEADRVACGENLFAATANEVKQLSPVKRSLGKLPAVGRLACDGATAIVEHHDLVVELPSKREHKVPGHPVALAAGDGKIYVATREGALYEISRETGARRDLGLGGWWGTLALAFAHGKLYAVTQAGKIWEIDPRTPAKTIVSMGGCGKAHARWRCARIAFAWPARRHRRAKLSSTTRSTKS